MSCCNPGPSSWLFVCLCIAGNHVLAQSTAAPRLVVQAGPVMDLDGDDQARLCAMDLSEDGTLVALSDCVWTTLWSTNAGKMLMRVPSSGQAVAISPDGSLLVVAQYPRDLSIWSVGLQERLGTVRLPGGHFLSYGDHLEFLQASEMLFCTRGTSFGFGRDSTTCMTVDLRDP